MIVLRDEDMIVILLVRIQIFFFLVLFTSRASNSSGMSTMLGQKFYHICDLDPNKIPDHVTRGFYVCGTVQ